MKNKILGSYRRMQESIRDKDYQMRVLKEETTFRYNDNEYVLQAGTCVFDCPADEYAKIIYMNSVLTKAWLGGQVQIQEIEKIAEEVWEQ